MKRPKRVFKDRVYEQPARVGRAVASPQRFELPEFLSQGSRAVENRVLDQRMQGLPIAVGDKAF
jgi:hypothetical protein